MLAVLCVSCLFFKSIKMLIQFAFWWNKPQHLLLQEHVWVNISTSALTNIWGSTVFLQIKRKKKKKRNILRAAQPSSARLLAARAGRDAEAESVSAGGRQTAQPDATRWRIARAWFQEATFSKSERSGFNLSRPSSADRGAGGGFPSGSSTGAQPSEPDQGRK